MLYVAGGVTGSGLVDARKSPQAGHQRPQAQERPLPIHPVAQNPSAAAEGEARRPKPLSADKPTAGFEPAPTRLQNGYSTNWSYVGDANGSWRHWISALYHIVTKPCMALPIKELVVMKKRDSPGSTQTP